MINLVIHDIVETEKEYENIYSLTLQYYLTLVEQMSIEFDGFRIYFDDGYKSYQLVDKFMLPYLDRIVFAIIADKIDTTGYLTRHELKNYSDMGIKISSHGVSHAALAIYKNNILQSTPLGGEYQNSPIGQENVLTYNEVLYQVKESKIFLESLDIMTDEFVLPYGLYNEQTESIVSTSYKYMATCEELVDNGQVKKPRILITNDRGVTETINFLHKIKHF